MPTVDLLGTTLNITATGTTETVGFNTNIAIIGGFDKNNAAADVTAAESTAVEGGASADNLFGADSELARAVAAASANPVGTIYGIPLPETSTTETFGSSSSTASFTLSSAPVFDPNVHPDHDIVVTDVTEGADCDVNYEYNGTPSTPSGDNVVNVNPNTGEVEADSASEYDVEYTYPTWDEAAKTAATLPVRYVIGLTEADSVKSTVLSQVTQEAKDGNFKRAVTGARPNIEVGGISDYTPTNTDWRLIEVAPSRATGSDGSVRTAAAVGGLLAAQPINADGSITYDDVNGLTELNKQYRPTEAEDFEQVTAVDRSMTVVGGKTTSNDSALRNIYEGEIIDTVAETLLVTVEDFKGGGYFDERVGLLRKAIERPLESFASQRPPLLADPQGGEPYQVTMGPGPTETEVVANVAIDPAPIMEEIKMNLNVGEIVTFEGVTTA